MPKLFLVSSKITIVNKIRDVVKYTPNFTIIYVNKINLQVHRGVSPSIPLEIKHTQQKNI